MQLEHEAAAWLDREHLHSVKWLHADDVHLLNQVGCSAELITPITFL